MRWDHKDETSNSKEDENEEEDEEQENEKEERKKQNALKTQESLDKLHVLKYMYLNCQHHIRSETLFNVSERKLITSTDHDNFVPSNIPKEYVWLPNQTANETCDLILSRYGRKGDTTDDRDDLRKMIYRDMKKFENYVIFDIDSINEEQFNTSTDTIKFQVYTVKCTMILEEELFFQNKSSCAIIHCIATEFDYETTHHLKSLLYKAFNQIHMRNKTVVFVYEYGDNGMIMFENDDESNNPHEFTTYEKIFADMGFKKADIESIANDIPRNSSTMIGDSKQITDYCKQYRKFSTDHDTDTHQICMFNGAKKIKYRFNAEKKLEVYSHTFEWVPGAGHDLDRITNIKREIAKNNSGTVYPFTGGGYHEPNNDKSQVTFNTNFPIPLCY